ncbi:hypothetical protein LV779_12800 [Streptomyces thinghirensis]|nr:hypothetical protein [Streptomyces thinghirensis]
MTGSRARRRRDALRLRAHPVGPGTAGPPVGPDPPLGRGPAISTRRQDAEHHPRPRTARRFI